MLPNIVPELHLKGCSSTYDSSVYDSFIDDSLSEISIVTSLEEGTLLLITILKGVSESQLKSVS